MNDLDAKIRTLVDGFVGQLSSLVQQSAVERAVDALRGSTEGKRGSTEAGRSNRRTSVAKIASSSKTRKGAKRSPKQIAGAVQRVLNYVKGHESARSEDIRKELKLSHAETGDALKRLLAKKSIKSRGARRATTYTVA